MVLGWAQLGIVSPLCVALAEVIHGAAFSWAWDTWDGFADVSGTLGGVAGRTGSWPGLSLSTQTLVIQPSGLSLFIHGGWTLRDSKQTLLGLARTCQGVTSSTSYWSNQVTRWCHFQGKEETPPLVGKRGTWSRRENLLALPSKNNVPR